MGEKLSLEAIVFWLQNTPGSIALRESIWAYPAVATLHVLAVAIFTGTIFLFDFRLLGLATKETAIPELWRRIRATILYAFCLAFASGAFLFFANPVRNYHSLWFRLKLLWLLIAALNSFAFHKGSTFSHRRLAALISILAWVLVVICGRLIAYNWFDCDRIEAYPWLLWLSGCGN